MFQVSQQVIGEAQRHRVRLAIARPRRVQIGFYTGAHHARLLVDFLEHEVLETLLFHHDGVPVQGEGALFEAIARKGVHLDAHGGKFRQLAIFQRQHGASVGHDRGRIRRAEKFALPKADDQRGLLPHHNQIVGIVGINHGQGKGPSS
jgi:hypothetical protein